MFILTFKKNIEDVLIRVKDAAAVSGREVSDIELVAVTKTVDVDIINGAIDCGVLHIGESRVQELLEKYEQIGDVVKWHLIGHLQRNKVKYIIDKVDIIHSLDSFRLAKEINKRAENINRMIECLLQVNVSKEKTKYGINLEDVEHILEDMTFLNNIRIVGLMTIAPHVEDKEQIRQCFRTLKNKFDHISNMDFPNVKMKYLSMGMSHDFEIAIQEGANFIRIGTSIFGERNYSK
ncbi:MAG TPA: YggS family pyridoxal phosphate-dependent enzyme [Oscillospiraceae bacterium]|nr:YggS family pyridoxal phosphate-dependent enzyme [Oscillospiraceae bacterium]